VADFERAVTIGVPADAAFAYLADPGNVAAYVGPISLVETVAVEGDPAEIAASDEADDEAEASFLADAGTRRVTWSRGGYAGSASVDATTASLSTITIRLHLRDDADPDAVRELLDATARNLQRVLLLRR
jgi:hypothetical protein